MKWMLLNVKEEEEHWRMDEMFWVSLVHTRRLSYEISVLKWVKQKKQRMMKWSVWEAIRAIVFMPSTAVCGVEWDSFTMTYVE